MEKLKSWPMWLALGAMVAWLVKSICKIDISVEVNEFLNLLLPILVGFGIVNDPNSRTHF